MGAVNAPGSRAGGERIVLKHGNAEVPVFLTDHIRARRISLRVDSIESRVVLVKPRRTSKRAAIAFAAEKVGWIADRLAELPIALPFEPLAVVPIYGRPHVIHHHPEARRGVWIEGDTLCVSGPIEHLSRRVHDWLKKEARRIISPAAHTYATELGVYISGISVRDTKTRWGSCTAAGKLSFSWRLILTPEDVLHYVVAHEVAHLREMNHSPKFWRVVESLIGDRKPPTRWLKTEGADLHRYGMKRPKA